MDTQTYNKHANTHLHRDALKQSLLLGLLLHLHLARIRRPLCGNMSAGCALYQVALTDVSWSVLGLFRMSVSQRCPCIGASGKLVGPRASSGGWRGWRGCAVAVPRPMTVCVWRASRRSGYSGGLHCQSPALDVPN
eukprot:1069397-Pelagomonas_calceolata.AAC.5